MPDDTDTPPPLPVTIDGRLGGIPTEHAEHWDSTTENREALQKLHTDVYGDINVGSRLPLDSTVSKIATMREMKTKIEWQKIRWQDVQGDIKQGRYWQAARTMFGWIFGGRRAVEGLGLYANSVDTLPLDVRRGVITQLYQHLEDGPRNVDDELKRSVVRFQTEESLRRRGFALERTATRSRHIVIEEGKTLADYVDESVMKRLRAAGGADPEILGPLTFDRPLPAGAYLYLDRDGFPLLVSEQLIPPGRFPPVPIYRRAPGAIIETASTRESKINFLQENIRPGDILLVSQHNADQTPFFRLLQNATQFLSARGDRGFHAGHVMVVGQGKTVHHIRMTGRYSGNLREQLNREGHRYSNITVARVTNPEKAEILAKRMEEIASRERTFNSSGFLRSAMDEVRQRMSKTLSGPRAPDTTSTDTSCICIDYATDAAKDVPGLEQLAACRTPIDVARCQDVRLVYSVELPQT